ncbi:MAG TPA: XRE family transcriptional regulator [Chitinophagaceae bacterium]
MKPYICNMTSTTNNPKTVHEGRNVKRFREMLGINQDTLASTLGDEWNQKKISLLEAKETIEPGLLEQVAKALKVPAEAIRNFNEDTAVNIISNTFTDNHNSAIGYTVHYNPSFNPLDKYVEQVEENKKLYEALLKSERERIVLLEKMLEKK